MTQPEIFDWRQLTRGQQVLLYVVVHLDELIAEGLVIGGNIKATDKTRAAVAEMQTEGFRPTPDEIKQTLAGLQNLRLPPGLRAV